MIEVSITEMVLFAWAIIATGLYFRTKQEEHMVRKLFMHMIENKEARDEMIKQYEMAQQRGDI
jgi:protease II